MLELHMIGIAHSFFRNVTFFSCVFFYVLHTAIFTLINQQGPNV